MVGSISTERPCTDCDAPQIEVRVCPDCEGEEIYVGPIDPRRADLEAENQRLRERVDALEEFLIDELTPIDGFRNEDRGEELRDEVAKIGGDGV